MPYFSPEKTNNGFSPLRSKAPHHGRSLSLPSASHPAISQFDDSLSSRRSSEGTSSSLSSMNERVNSLKNLYESIDDLLLLNGLRGQENLVKQLLDDYIQLLDSCSMVRDLVSFTEQDVRNLLLAVRREDVNGIQGYVASRKKSKKTIQMSLKSLRSLRSKDSEETGVICMLKEAESVTFSLFESQLAYTIGSDVQERRTNHLKEMNSSIQVLEEELEFLFKKLIETRVFLLNSLNH